jgi:N-acetyltransferase
LRQHVILADGFVRDSVVFSIIQSEWSTVKSLLEQRLMASHS